MCPVSRAGALRANGAYDTNQRDKVALRQYQDAAETRRAVCSAAAIAAAADPYDSSSWLKHLQAAQAALGSSSLHSDMAPRPLPHQQAELAPASHVAESALVPNAVGAPTASLYMSASDSTQWATETQQPQNLHALKADLNEPQPTEASRYKRGVLFSGDRDTPPSQQALQSSVPLGCPTALSMSSGNSHQVVRNCNTFEHA
jgi:hypothetical protein